MAPIHVGAGGEDRAHGATGRDVLAGVWNIANGGVIEPGGGVTTGDVVAREHDRFATHLRGVGPRQVERRKLAGQAGGCMGAKYRNPVRSFDELHRGGPTWVDLDRDSDVVAGDEVDAVDADEIEF